MSDLISRQAAIDAIEKKSQIDGAYGYTDTKSIVDMLEDLPSAQPGRKTGKWIHKSSKLAPLNTIWWYECSVCGCHAFNDMLTYFCPKCGADMRGGEDG